MKTDTDAKTTKTPGLAVRVPTYILAAIFVLLPFHAFLTVSLSGVMGNYDVLRVWKELLLLAIVPVTAAVILARQARASELWNRLKGNWLFWSMAAYVALHVLLGIVAYAKGQVNLYALLYAWLVNLRLVLVFALAFVLAMHWPWLRQRWHQLLLWPAAFVVLFGLLQVFALPTDFLGRFNYGPETIKAYETVDQKLDYVRIQSTLRGANPLGAYMVLVISAITVLLLRKRDDRREVSGVVLLLGGLVVLLMTYSRSAYIGATLAVLMAVWLVMHGRLARRRLAIGLVALAVAGASLAYVFRENDHLENALFHTNEQTHSTQSSNDVRATALTNGWSDAVSEPFGRGPGTAGPASVHNDRPERIAENYYLQLVQELGWPGLLLFLSINVLIAAELWRRRFDEKVGTLSRVLLASLAGIAFINLVQHAWTDDTLGLIWWGFAGVALASGAVKADVPSKKRRAAKTARRA